MHGREYIRHDDKAALPARARFDLYVNECICVGAGAVSGLNMIAARSSRRENAGTPVGRLRRGSISALNAL